MDDILENFLQLTAWEIIKPKPYGLFHIGFMAVGFLLCGFAAWKLRRLGDRGNRILLLSCGIFLTVCEAYKQLFYWYIIEPGIYSWWIFPFQLCSVPMYLCILAPLLKPGRLQNALYSFMMLYNLLGGAISFAEPSGLLHGYLTLTGHAFLWHMLLVFIGLYLAFSGRGGWDEHSYRRASSVFLICCCIAFAINLLFRNVSEGTINMFFIGPKVSSLIVFKQIGELLGWYVSTAVYIPAVCLGAWLIWLPIHYFHQKSSAAV